MRRTAHRDVSIMPSFSVAALLVLVSVSSGFAQSQDASYPTPVVSNEVTGRIAPRDIGDARLTRHFYAFTGVEGDLVVTVESADLNGSVDLFTAGSLRPLTKITLYAGSSVVRATKSIYLRTQEPLLLRVEGRSAGDTDAVYRIRFEGAFSPLVGELAQAPEPAPPTLSEPTGRDRHVRRVNSVGARIEEPASETALQPETQPTTTAPTDAQETEEAAAAKPPTRRGTSQPRRSSRPARSSGRTTGRRTNLPRPSDRAETSGTEASPAPASESPAAETSTGNETSSTTPRNTRTARNRPPRRTKRGGQPPDDTTAAAVVPSEGTPPAEATAPPAAAASPRLIIVTRDGETLERDMTTVRRVTVENNQIVVVGKDGKVTRQPMSNVVRMAIEP